MKLLIDLTSIIDSKPTGIQLMALNITKELIRLYPENEIHLVFYKKIPDDFSSNCQNENIYYHLIPSCKGIIMRLFLLPKVIHNMNADYNMFFSIAAPFTVSGKRAISVVHDLTPWEYPKTMTTSAVIYWRIRILNAVYRSKYLLTVSNTVKNEIRKRFKREDVTVIYPGLTLSGHPSDLLLTKYDIKKDEYILSVATLEPRKNLGQLLEAYYELRRNRDIGQKLVLVGGNGWKEKLSPPPELDDEVIFTGYVSDDELITLYMNAALFVLPSIYEGFGSPVIEAIECKCKVLLSDIPVFRETTSNLATYFKLNDTEDLQNKIQILLNTDDDEKTRRLYANNQKYSWEKYAVSVMKMIKSDLIQHK